MPPYDRSRVISDADLLMQVARALRSMASKKKHIDLFLLSRVDYFLTATPGLRQLLNEYADDRGLPHELHLEPK